MKSDHGNRQMTTGGVTAAGSFGLSGKESDVIHLMRVLRDTLYSDKVLAVMREYGANAWDANRMAGRGTVPIEVSLPTRGNPVLRIRDFGPGLSEEDVFTVYTQYGASTKRDTDEAVGNLGIGSKSGFAYADTFTVTSWYGGEKKIYIAVIDETDRGTMNRVYVERACFADFCGPLTEAQETECAATTGVEITIAVKPEDVYEFTAKAEFLFQHFEPRPVINCDLAPIPSETVALANGNIIPVGKESDKAGEWVAVMGCVPYKVDLDQVPEKRRNKCLSHLAGVLKFPIGAVDIAGSRETLRYSPKTKEALADKLDDLVDEFVLTALDLCDSDDITPWEKRLKVKVLLDLDIDVPELFEKYTTSRVTLVDPESTKFTLTHNKASVGSVTIAPNLRIILDDTKKARSLRGYALTTDDYVAKGLARMKIEDLRAEVEKVLEACNLRGVPVKLLSEITWTAPNSRVNYAAANAKHKQRSFVLDTKSRYFRRSKRGYSPYWTAVERVAEAEDVFVVLEDFKSYDSFYDNVVEDRRVAEALGVTYPAVYGYKSTKAKPKTPADCTGTEYRAWRKKFYADLLTPERIAVVDAHLLTNSGYYYGTPSKQRAAAIEAKLGVEHPIVKFIARVVAAADLASTVSSEIVGILARHANRDVVSIKDEGEALTKPYPLLKHSGYHNNGISKLWSAYDSAEEWKEWLRYIQLVDADLATRAATKSKRSKSKEKDNEQPDPVHSN